MAMKRFLALAFLTLAATAVAAEDLTPRAQRWWDDIKVLANDSMEGRQTGSQGYMRAAEFVIERFHAEALTTAVPIHGFEQPVAFETQKINQQASYAYLLRPDGSGRTLKSGETILVSAGGGPRPAQITAPLVFAGYGLHLPKAGYDDFRGIDVKGKIVVVISGGPDKLPGPLKAAARAERVKFLGQSGALGLITLTTPKQVEIPWARQKLLSGQTGMYLADKTLRETPDGMYLASVDPEQAQMLFEDAPYSFAQLAAQSDGSGPMVSFDMPLRLKAGVVADHGEVHSPNLIAKLEGSDPNLKDQYVVVSAHLDHLGVGAPINGDAIYNGAMDDASGVASVLDIAHRLRLGPRPKRSILFVIVTGEEKGLLGSHYFAANTIVPKGSIVADLNFDMPLPLWPLKSVIAQGDGESTLGETARQVAAAQALTVAPDPLPDRNSFIRTDQFSFVKAGVPSLAFKFGFAKGTQEFQIEHDWRANRYHAPSDDVNQPGVLKNEAIKLDDYVAGIALKVADTPAAPQWLATSSFKPGG
jgi:Zn-dependent M28 family amino/carboxypeptidase